MKVFQDLKNKVNYEGEAAESTFNFIDKMFFKELFENIKNLIVLFICAVLSSCRMASDATPFRLATFGALSALNIPLIVPFVLISVITGIVLGKVALLKFVIAGIIYVAIKAFVKTEDSKMGNAMYEGMVAPYKKIFDETDKK